MFSVRFKFGKVQGGGNLVYRYEIPRLSVLKMKSLSPSPPPSLSLSLSPSLSLTAPPESLILMSSTDMDRFRGPACLVSAAVNEHEIRERSNWNSYSMQHQYYDITESRWVKQCRVKGHEAPMTPYPIVNQRQTSSLLLSAWCQHNLTW